MLTVIASVEHELAGMRRGLQSIPTGNAPQVALQVVGVGAARSRSNLQDLLRRYADKASFSTDTDQALLLLGFAGAVDSGLRTGDLVLASRYYRVKSSEDPQGDGDILTPDTAMRDLAREVAADSGISLIHIDSLTVDSLAATPAAKAALGRQYPVGLVNMEDYWLAVLARDVGVPFLSVRVILDPTSQSLPQYLLSLSQTRPLTVLRTAAMPWRIPTLLQLGRQMRLAQGPLTQFGLAFIKQYNDGHSRATPPMMASAAG